MNTPLAPTLGPCTCFDKTWCPACTADRAAKRPGTTAQQRYYSRNREKMLAYAARYRATRPQPRLDDDFAPLPAALVAAALSGIPPLWRHADVFGPGPYLWHCKVWQKIDAIPHICPGCGTRFFEKETA